MNKNEKTKGKQTNNSLSSVKTKKLSKQPIIENTIARSEDGKWLIHKIVITDTKPVTYFEKVLARGS